MLVHWGLPAGTKAAVFEFWEGKFLGPAQDRVTLKMPPESSRILAIRRLSDRPQVIGTDMHVLSGYHEIERLAWDPARKTLSGRCRRAPGLSGRVFLHVPRGYQPRPDGTRGSAPSTQIADCLWAQAVEFKEPTADWSIAF